MKKITLIALLLIACSCESNRDRCIRKLVDEQGYSYNDACEQCDEVALESVRK
jgi:hypothetical protein